MSEPRVWGSTVGRCLSCGVGSRGAPEVLLRERDGERVVRGALCARCRESENATWRMRYELVDEPERQPTS